MTAAYHASLAMGVSIDKVGVLEAAMERLADAKSEATEQQLAQLVSRLRGFMVETGLDEGEPRVLAAIQRWFDGPPPSVAVGPARSLPESVTVEAMPEDAEVVPESNLTPIGVIPSERVAREEAGGDEPTTASEQTGNGEQIEDVPAQPVQAPRGPNYTPLPRGWEQGGAAPGGRGRGRGPAGRAGA
jgi:hypothetical protein